MTTSDQPVSVLSAAPRGVVTVRRAFTMVEILVAMSILVVMMFLLVRFFNGAQNAWRLTAANTRIYENARVLLDVITRDLEGAVASNDAQHQIPFYVGPNADGSASGTWGDRQIVAFVATTGPTSDANAALTEVSYDFYDGSDASRSAHRYAVRRHVTYDRDSGGENADWDFYLQTTGGTGAANWNITGLLDSTLTDSELMDNLVVRGVADIQMTCYTSYPTGSPLATDTCVTTLPAMVLIQVTLFDERLVDLADELGAAWQTKVNQSKRTFTKTIFLKQGY